MLAYSDPHESADGSGCRDLVRLLWLCVADCENSLAWSAFLGTILPKLGHFIRGSLRQLGYGPGFCDVSGDFGGHEVEDFIQTTIVRLVQDKCALLKRFRGETEENLFAYLAVISRSVVRDCWRRQNSGKRTNIRKRGFASPGPMAFHSNGVPEQRSIERRVLAMEVADLLRCTLDDAENFSERDRLICNLHFINDLSAAQIARCQGIGLTKPGVEKVLSRVKKRIRSKTQIGATEVPCRA